MCWLPLLLYLLLLLVLFLLMLSSSARRLLTDILLRAILRAELPLILQMPRELMRLLIDVMFWVIRLSLNTYDGCTGSKCQTL